MEISNGHQHNLVWSFQPIFYSIRVLGVDLDVTQPRSKLRRYGFVMFQLSLMALVLSSALIHYFTWDRERSQSPASAWCGLLRHGARLTSTILFQLVFFSMTSLRWKKFWKEIEKMEQFVAFQPFFPHSLRRVIIFASAFIFTLEFSEKVTGLFYGLGWKKINEGGIEAVEAVGFIIGESYECFLVVLFVSLTWLANMSIQILIQDVQTDTVLLELIDNVVLNWKRRYCIILEFIEEVNDFFGPALLIFISKYVLMFIVYSFMLVNQFHYHSNSIFALGYMIRNLFLILLLVIGTQKMKNKASILAGKLTKLRFDDNAAQSNVNHFISGIYQRPPIISPLGVFEINPRIITSCISTTLTYLLILTQYAANFWEE